MGNTRFVVELLRAYPDLIFEKNDDEHTIFHIAVMHRHQGIYNLFYEIGSRKDRITNIEDRGNNNMLHLLALTTVKIYFWSVSTYAAGVIVVQDQRRSHGSSYTYT